MIIWSYDHMIIWSYDRMVIWSYDNMIIWSYGCEKLTNKSSRRGGKVLLPRFGGSASILYRRRRFRRRQQAVNFSRNFGRPFTPQTRLESSPNFNTLHYKPSPTFHFSILIQVKNTNLPAQTNTNIFFCFLKLIICWPTIIKRKPAYVSTACQQFNFQLFQKTFVSAATSLHRVASYVVIWHNKVTSRKKSSFSVSGRSVLKMISEKFYNVQGV